MSEGAGVWLRHPGAVTLAPNVPAARLPALASARCLLDT